MYWICLSSLHSSVVIEGYVKRQTCCCSLQQPQELHINITKTLCISGLFSE